MVSTHTIVETVGSGLCTGCGTCVGMCPNSAIRMVKDSRKGVYIPKLDGNSCSLCGICHEVCPGLSVDFERLNFEIFGQNPTNVFLGSFIRCYVGHATNRELRFNSASGGIVTSLLIHALDKGIIDGALLTRMSPEDPLEPETLVATTKEQIISASGSHYHQVPLNVALRKILKENGRFGVVGLPCHIQGIRKAELASKTLREKIALHLGLFCGHTPSSVALEFLLKQVGIAKEDVKEIRYRSGGWPGGMSVKARNGKAKFIPFYEYWTKGFGLFFFPNRCTLCCDGTSELADVSLGDAWLPELVEDRLGTSVAISRTRRGERLLRSACLGKKIRLEYLDPQKVVQSQEKMLLRKKQGLQAHIRLFKLIDRKTPHYNSLSLKAGFLDYLEAASFHFWLKVYSIRSLWTLLGMYTTCRIQLAKYFLKDVLRTMPYHRDVFKSN